MILNKQLSHVLLNVRHSVRHKSSQSFKLVIAGGGTAGLSVANQFSKILGKGNIAVIEPSDVHYYQPMWTFVGGGIKSVNDSRRPLSELISPECTVIRNKVAQFNPKENEVKLEDKSTINYEYLVVALGINMDLNKVKGLKEALKTEGVCSNYMVDTVGKTWESIQNFKGGNAIFTFPNTPIKCAGAPQKIMYLADDYFRKVLRHNKRDKAKIMFNSALGVIFAVPKYASTLNEIVKKRNIELNFKHNLIEIKPEKKEAIFEKLENGEKVSFQYDLLHVTPPQRPSEILSPLADAAGFVDVNKETLQHQKYKNVFSLGDCSNAPKSRTAAAVAAESGVVVENLNACMNKKEMKEKYNGYTSCPLITSYNTVVLAEFDYNLKPLETFPINQGIERKSMFWMTKDVIPFIYWNLMARGRWRGPKVFRKLMRLGRSE
ncbi:hypothetical protein B4U80_08175 [Leptotrombidium deliense]|uniref:Sulfide:quinone oxidoreductase, mitochondrial n=1 Tax=Leptotrombidium deliense TaxID=299467 RepID=A0A443SDZ2_9ACAR|nr:hypothetical protein B4U80_08175 [Leptotrombidium deliense]